MRRHLLTVSLAASVALALAACSGSAGDASSPPDPATGTGHGHVEGAAELPEPQRGLTTVDARGAVHHLDLLDESVRDLGSVPAPARVTSDGRFLFSDDGGGVTVIDSGVWTWDHVDHFHYYRAEPRILGTVPGDGPAAVATTNSSTTGGTGLFFGATGEAVLLDTKALSTGELRELFRLDREPHAGLVVPFGAYAAITTRSGGIEVVTTEGDSVARATIDCAAPTGTITTRVGAVVGCADGAVLATTDESGPVLEKIPYPAGTTAPPATSFANREGRPTVAATAGEAGIWLLDTRARRWTLLPAPAPLLQVTAVDDDAGNLLALSADGRVLVLDAATGEQRAVTAPLLPRTIGNPEAMTGVTLIADQQRAYLNAPLERRLYEIDFADTGRIARTFEPPVAPAFLAETGR